MIKFFSAELSKLYDMLDFIRQAMRAAKFDLRSMGKIELASEEMLVNIIHYGYPEKKGEIGIQCRLLPNFIEIIIKDRGIPYNPLKRGNLKACLEEKVIGGYGIFLTLNLMDEVAYKREKNINILTLRKAHQLEASKID